MISALSKKQQRIKRSVLIIEDERFLCNLLVKKFENGGFQVIGALDGETGLKEVRERIPDVILLDLLLPGIDGFEVLRRLKKDEELRRIPVIIISNLSDKRDIEKAHKGGAAAYLVKADFSPQDILDKVRQFIV